MNELRTNLPPLPPKMRSLPIDRRGYPVPFFVALIDGEPDHRVVEPEALQACVRDNRCWLCGGYLGAFKAFVIGPMCSITRTISEPPSHLECAQYAAIACPFMTRPMAKRREANMPDGVRPPPGNGLTRNPGAVCVWVTKKHKPFRAGTGLLFDIGDPDSTHWYAEGRDATREEVDESIRTGLPHLHEPAQAQGPHAVAELARRIAESTAMLDRVLPRAIA